MARLEKEVASAREVAAQAMDNEVEFRSAREAKNELQDRLDQQEAELESAQKLRTELEKKNEALDSELESVKASQEQSRSEIDKLENVRNLNWKIGRIFCSI